MREGLPPAPCLGSGYCCKKARCTLGAYLHGPGRDCPSLVFKDGRYWCGAVLDAEGERKQFLIDQLHIGAGCCSSLNSDRQKMLRER